MQDSGDAYWHIASDGIYVLPYQDMNVKFTEWVGFRRRRVYEFRSAAAAMRLFDLLKEEEISLGKHDVLRESFLAARAKPVGDRWRFDRDVLVDQSPVVAVSVAVDVAAGS